MKKKKGFTLVELLAVIVILAVILIIAMPKISDVIKNSKEASLETTSKLIASQAEKKYMENEVLGNTGSFGCSDVVKINSSDYASCTITFDTNGNALVSINGSGKFAGLTIKNATKNSATATELTATDSKYFSYELQADGLTGDKSKIYDVTVADQSKCVAYIKNMGAAEEVATTACSGGVINDEDETLVDVVKNDEIPASDYDLAGLNVKDVYKWYDTNEVTVAYQSNCVAYIKNIGETEEVATTACSGGVINGLTLADLVKNDDIPASHYEAAGLKVTSKVYDKFGLSITGYNPLGGLDVVIPSYIDGYKVTTIASNAFESKGLKSVVIPNTVKTIGADAFRKNKLTYVVIPSSVTYIGERAFLKNYNLKIFNNSSIPNTQHVWDEILGINGACSPKVTITNNIIEIGMRRAC